ncbi:MAG: CNNM domain-containing protein [Lentisphaerae bacterium]|nr:CNNM domain-containing protein [Lentisphaerota bacterium]
MTTALIIAGAILLALLVCSAFFSSAETALFSLNSLQVRRLQRAHPHAGTQLERLLAKPRHLLSTLLIGNTIVNVCASALGFTIAERLLPDYGEAVSIPVMTILLLLFGEVAPKRFAMLQAERLALFYQVPLRILLVALKPARVAMENVTRFIEKHLPGRVKALSEEEFRTVVEVGAEEGVVDREEKSMVEGIIRLEETQASDVMTPRVDLVGLDLDDPPERHREIARSVIYRFLPIYRGSPDHPEGFLDVPRYLLAESPTLADAMLPPVFVPETAPLDTLLAQFQREHRRVAFVVDEFGGTAGVITRGDILEVIAPDLEEYGEPRLTIQKVRANAWLIDGSASLEDVNYELETSLEAEGADRIAGWFLAQAERIPKAGDVVEAHGCRVTAQRVRRRRITLVLLEKIEAPPVDETEVSHD